MRKKKRIAFHLGLSFIGFILLPICISFSQAKPVYVIQLDDATINPVTADYIGKSIDRAYKEGAQCIIIKLDTPGGLLSSTRTIVKKILSARIPVIVYIYPSGSRAGSAGVFITYASHVAAMAPATNIGAAHPVQMGGGGSKGREKLWEGLKEMLEESKRKREDIAKGKHSEDKAEKIKEKKKKDKKSDEIKADEDPMSSKILEDTVAFIRAMAQERNRNVEWAIKSVTESSSITETEAKQLGVIEIIAKSDLDLLKQLDGRVVKIEDQEITLFTKDAALVNLKMSVRERVLNVLVNPNIAYMFMILGFWGLLYEITHPGIGVPGVLGAIFLILAFYSMQTLPTNYAGVALIGLALILFIAEASVPGIGLLVLGGIVCMVLGSLMLFDSADPVMRVSLILILAITVFTATASILIIRLVLKLRVSHPLNVSGRF